MSVCVYVYIIWLLRRRYDYFGMRTVHLCVLSLLNFISIYESCSKQLKIIRSNCKRASLHSNQDG